MKILKLFSCICMLVFLSATSVTAVESISNVNTVTPDLNGNDRSSVTALDDECIIDFVEFTHGTYEGGMVWPGGNGQYRMSLMVFTNSCTPGEYLYAYCNDLNHPLEGDPYCVDIDSMVVRAAYPDQVPAMAFIMTWLQPTTNPQDRVKQLAVWKLSNDNRMNEPSYGIPFFYTDAGRGYPAIGDTPVFPYVNTVYNNDSDMNDPANAVVLDALGYGIDGIAKNVAMCDDYLLIATEEAVVEGDIATVPVTVTLERGAAALAVNNLSLSGVKLLIGTDNGVLSKEVDFTDVNGQVSFTISQQIAEHYDANLHICTYSAWPQKIAPCDTTNGAQRLIVQELAGSELCSLCVDLMVSGDQFLPVELNSFTAIAGDREVMLNWSTASERNSDRFEILRGETLVGRVAAENSATGSNYSWTDQYLTNGTEYTYSLVSVDLDGARNELATVSATPTFEAAEVTEFALHQNYPNPFNPETQISFDIAEAVSVKLGVYNMLGQQVASLVNGPMAPGRHSVMFQATDLPSGMYLYRLEAGDFTAQHKMILMK